MSNFDDTNLIVFTDKLSQTGTNIAKESQGNARIILPVLRQVFSRENIDFYRHSPKLRSEQQILRSRELNAKALKRTKKRW